MAKSQLHDLARLGAQSRLDALDREREEIFSIFPELRSKSASAPARGATRPAAAAGRRRGGMSAEARKAQSARMTAYWAARRAAKSGATGEGTGAESGEGTRGSRKGRKGRRKK